MAVAMLVVLLAANVLLASAGKFASLPKTGCSKSACANPTMGFYKGTFTSAAKDAIQNMNYGAYVRKPETSLFYRNRAMFLARLPYPW